VSREEERAKESKPVKEASIRVTLVRLASGVSLHVSDPAHTPGNGEGSSWHWVPDASNDIEENEGRVALQSVLVATLDAVELLLVGISGVHVRVGDLVLLASGHDLATEVLEGEEGSNLTNDHVAKLSGDVENSHCGKG